MGFEELADTVDDRIAVYTPIISGREGNGRLGSILLEDFRRSIVGWAVPTDRMRRLVGTAHSTRKRQRDLDKA